MNDPGVRIPFSPPLKFKIMKEQLRELINNEQISEPEVMDVVLGYHKLVKLGMLNKTDFEILQMTLGIFEVSPGVFSLNEDETYTLG
jgi:hypothetical protein